MARKRLTKKLCQEKTFAELVELGFKEADFARASARIRKKAEPGRPGSLGDNLAVWACVEAIRGLAPYGLNWACRRVENAIKCVNSEDLSWHSIKDTHRRFEDERAQSQAIREWSDETLRGLKSQLLGLKDPVAFPMRSRDGKKPPVAFFGIWCDEEKPD